MQLTLEANTLRIQEWTQKMVAKQLKEGRNIGGQLVAIRKQRGWSQYELAKRAGISQRMVAYYEAQGGEPPAHVIVQLARALSVSTDQLLGIESSTALVPKDVRLWRRLLKVQEFDEKDRRVVTEMIDALHARQKTLQAS